MAYHYTTGNAENKMDFLSKLKAFLVDTAGWTLWDDQRSLESEPYFVVKSEGESGNEDIYISFGLDNACHEYNVAVLVYNYWNPTTHSGIYTTGNTITVIRCADNDMPFNYWLYADKDIVYVITHVGGLVQAGYYGFAAGTPERFHNAGMAVTVSDASSGDNVVVEVTDASMLEVGKQYVIRDNAGIKLVTVIAVNTSGSPNTVTLDNLNRIYDAGSRIAIDPQPLFVSYYGALHGSSAYWTNGPQAATTNELGRIDTFPTTVIEDAAADGRTGTYTAYPLHVTTDSGTGKTELRGQLKYVLCLGYGDLLNEDTVVIDGFRYRVFGLSTTAMHAFREDSVGA